MPEEREFEPEVGPELPAGSEEEPEGSASVDSPVEPGLLPLEEGDPSVDGASVEPAVTADEVPSSDCVPSEFAPVLPVEDALSVEPAAAEDAADVSLLSEPLESASAPGNVTPESPPELLPTSPASAWFASISVPEQAANAGSKANT